MHILLTLFWEVNKTKMFQYAFFMFHYSLNVEQWLSHCHVLYRREV